METPPSNLRESRMIDYKPVTLNRRRTGTGYIKQINGNHFECRYSPMWFDGKKHSRNVYAHTSLEYEAKLKVLIIEMKTELKLQKAEGTLPPQELEKGKKDRRKRRRSKRTNYSKP